MAPVSSPNPDGPHPGLGEGNSPLEDVNMGGRQHNLAGEGAGAEITVRLAIGAWAQDFWDSGQAGPCLFPLGLPSVQQEGFRDSLGPAPAQNVQSCCW